MRNHSSIAVNKSSSFVGPFHIFVQIVKRPIHLNQVVKLLAKPSFKTFPSTKSFEVVSQA